MRAVYRITSNEHGVILLKRRKIAKAFRWWLRENGIAYNSTIFFN
jgi:hypothetical protein